MRRCESWESRIIPVAAAAQLFSNTFFLILYIKTYGKKVQINPLKSYKRKIMLKLILDVVCSNELLGDDWK